MVCSQGTFTPRGILIPLDRLEPWSAFKNTVWARLREPITRQEVDDAIRQGRLRKTPLGPGGPRTARRSHVQRIAYLVLHPAEDPIDIDVGVRSSSTHLTWPICNGNHRLAAAFYRGDDRVCVDIGGSVAYAQQLLNLKLRMTGNEMVLAEEPGVVRRHE